MVKILKSFSYASSGLIFCFKTQQNFRINLLAAIIAVIAGICLHINQLQWIAVTICISAVLAAELMNTAVEKICGHVNPSYHPQIKIIKDMAAGAVLIIALMSMVTGLLIFIPALLNYINS
jgi:diacylglycerol kinase